MHKWIMESEYLSNMLYDLYKHYGDDYKKTLSINEKRQFKEYQLRVCQVYRLILKFKKNFFFRIFILVIGLKILPCILILINV